MELTKKVLIHNRFDVHIDNIETGEHREVVAHNIVLNAMYNRLCAGNTYFDYIHFGTGTGTPTTERTSLFSHLGTKGAVTEETIKALPVSSWKRKVVLNPEEFVGSTIKEVGIAYDSGTSSLVTHAMLKDSEGNPISITKTATDVITIYATVFVTFSSPYANFKFIKLNSNGNSLINYLIGGSSAPTGSFGLNALANPYQRLGSTSSVTWTSDVANKKRKTNVARFGTTVGNGNVKVLDFTNLFELELPQVGVFTGQPYLGVNIGVGDGSKKEFILPSGNARQDSVSVKVDGIASTSFSKKTANVVAERIMSPAIPPLSTGMGVALTPDGLVMAVVHDYSPFVTTYDWVDNAWIKRADPAIPPLSPTSGVALTPDGLVMAVVTNGSPYITVYDWFGGAWVKRANPASLPPGTGYGVALTPDGLVMAVVTNGSPYITVYGWVDNAWIKRANPASLPPSTTRGVALTPDGLVMAVAHNVSPFVTTYDLVDNAWIKRADPASLPSTTGMSVALTPDGLVMAVVTNGSPYITVYDWFGGAWVKRANPATLPTGTGYGVALTSDGLVMAVGHDNSPYITVYGWVDNAWIKRANPASLPSSTVYGVALTSDGLVIAVGHYGMPYITTYRHFPRTTITFDSPPATGAVITADYTVDGIHKTDQYVVDVSFAIQFGEGS